MTLTRCAVRLHEVYMSEPSVPASQHPAQHEEMPINLSTPRIGSAEQNSNGNQTPSMASTMHNAMPWRWSNSLHGPNNKRCPNNNDRMRPFLRGPTIKRNLVIIMSPNGLNKVRTHIRGCGLEDTLKNPLYKETYS